VYLVKYISGIYGSVDGKVEVAQTIYGGSNFLIFGLIGLMVARVNVVEAVQLIPKQLLKIKEYQLPPSLIDYSPSTIELSIVSSFGVFVMLLLIS